MGNYDETRRGVMAWQGTLEVMRAHGTQLLLTGCGTSRHSTTPDIEQLIVELGPKAMLWNRHPDVPALWRRAGLHGLRRSRDADAPAAGRAAGGGKAGDRPAQLPRLFRFYQARCGADQGDGRVGDAQLHAGRPKRSRRASPRRRLRDRRRAPFHAASSWVCLGRTSAALLANAPRGAGGVETPPARSSGV